MQLKGEDTQARELRRGQLFRRQVISIQCTHCSDCNTLISKQYPKEAGSLILGPKPNGYIQSHVPQGTVTELGSFVIS